MRYLLRAGAFAAVLSLAALSVGQAQAATPRERALARQVATLKKQNVKLKRQLKITRAQLTTCQQGVGPAASTMTPFQLATTVFPAANLVFEHWQDGYGPGQFSTFDLSSHTLTEGYNEHWTYTFSLDGWK